MSQKNSVWKTSTQSTLRQWRSTPTYFFLVWRWGTWLLAAIWFFNEPVESRSLFIPAVPICLVLSFVYSLLVTLYTPVSRTLIAQLPYWQRQVVKNFTHNPRKGKQRTNSGHPPLLTRKEEPHLFRPLLDTHNPYLNIAVYCLDVIICGLFTYFSALNGGTPFGDSSPLYRYGLSAILVAGFTYSYGGGLLAALGYDLFILYGAFVYPPGQVFLYDRQFLGLNLAGSLIDAPLVALLAAFVAAQLNKAIITKRQEQETARREKALRGVSEILVTNLHDQVQLLRRSVKAIRQGGHFEKLVIALVLHNKGEEPHPDFDTYVEADVAAQKRPDVSEELVSLVAKTAQRHVSFDPLSDTLDGSSYGTARLYLPFLKEDQVYLVIGAEGTRSTPFDKRQEEFLATIGPQMIVALENIRLTAESATLATLAERGRIAREIHDGVAQLLYMLALNSETCLALAQRAGENETLAPLKQSLERQVTISKQALWETRHYMFTLQPLISGTTTLTEMLTMQLHEFEAITNLPTHLEVEGEEEAADSDAQHKQYRLQMAMAIFRIVQEALTNAYKHAQASQLEVRLRYQPACIVVEISDNGRGMPDKENNADVERIYSGRGLRGMSERAAELHGVVEIRASATGGTCVVASIPLEPLSEEKSTRSTSHD